MRSFELVLTFAILVGSSALTVSGQGFKKFAVQANETKTEQPSSPMDVAIDRIIARERDEVTAIGLYKPIVETYIQDLKPDKDNGGNPEP